MKKRWLFLLLIIPFKVNALEAIDITNESTIKINEQTNNKIIDKEGLINEIRRISGYIISVSNYYENLDYTDNKVLEENETSVNDYKSGKQNALKFLMGMIMKETKGSANPKIVNDMLLDLLSKDVNWLLFNNNV